jgi:hypothetical protein
MRGRDANPSNISCANLDENSSFQRAAELTAFHKRLVENLKSAFGVFMSGDVATASIDPNVSFLVTAILELPIGNSDSYRLARRPAYTAKGIPGRKVRGSVRFRYGNESVWKKVPNVT